MAHPFIGNPLGAQTVSAATLPAAAALSAAVTAGGPYTVQPGGSNPLSAVATAGLPGGCVVGVSDLGGCGGPNLPGFGIAYWTGSEWRRSTRGVQASRPDSGTVTLDYWTDPTRIKLTAGTAPRVLIANGKVGHIVTLYREGVLSATKAFDINLSGGSAGTDLTTLGSALASFEVLASGQLSAVNT